MNIEKQNFNTVDVLYDDKKWGKRIDPDEWNSNFKVLEEGHNELAQKLNQQVSDIDNAIQSVSEYGGSNVKVNYGGASETLQGAVDNIVSDIENRYTKTEVDATIGSNTNSLLANVEYNESTGVFTFIKKDGSRVVFDTVLEKVPAKMYLSEYSNGFTYLVIQNVDGSTTKTNVTNLLKDTIVSDSDTIKVVSTGRGVSSGGEHATLYTEYTVSVRDNSIGLPHIDTQLAAKFEETQTAKNLAVQAKDNAVSAKNASETAQRNAETFANNAETSSLEAQGYAEEAKQYANNSQGYANQSESYKNSAELAKVAAEKARDDAQAIAGGNFANHTLITIPAGRMRGDVDGDGKFTFNKSDSSDISTDVGLIFAHVMGNQTLTDATQLLCADVNGDGDVDSNDTNIVFSGLATGSFKPGSCGAEVTGNWTNNPNYATEEGQFYTNIPITGMTANHSASVIVKGTFENGFFPKAECVDGAIRIYAKLCPIEALTAVVSWGTGDGTAVITTESEDLTSYDAHIADTDIHVTADEKAAWSEKEIFIATYGTTTSAEIEAAYQAGKMIFCKYNSFMFQFVRRFSETWHAFISLIASNAVRYVTCSSNTWDIQSYTPNQLPAVTADDNGKILQVVDGVWTAVTPS